MSDSRRIAISGASGLLGQALTRHLKHQGHTVVPLVRQKSAAPSRGIYWSPDKGELDREALEGLDALVHLAGESIAGARWSEAKKRRILESRVQGTRLLASALASLNKPPAAFLSGSAVGFYGDGGERLLGEDSPPGTGFLAEVCKAWEQAAEPARKAGIRTVFLRTGLVLAREGGALATMLPLFRAGMGGRLGSGAQYMSWIAIEDHVRAMEHLLFRTDLEGPVNMVGPMPVTNAEFTRVLGRVLGRPTILPAPGPMLRLALGEMGEELLLKGQRADSRRLEASGFVFRHQNLESALRSVLGG